MTATRKAVSLSVALALGISGVAVLSACSPQQMVQNAVENAVEDATGADINVGDGASMPADWPASVPVVDGSIVASTAIGDAGARTWTVTISVSDPQAAYAEAKAALEAAGLTSSMDMSTGDTFGGVFGNASYSLLVSTATDPSGGTITYVLGDGSNAG